MGLPGPSALSQELRKENPGALHPLWASVSRSLQTGQSTSVFLSSPPQERIIFLLYPKGLEGKAWTSKPLSTRAMAGNRDGSNKGWDFRVQLRSAEPELASTHPALTPRRWPGVVLACLLGWHGLCPVS